MKKVLLCMFTVALVFTMVGSAGANALPAVSIYVDAAPNVYGSPDYPGWQAGAFAAAAGGTFVNMANSVNPANQGSTDFEIQDEVVYSFGDLGKRLTWIYWIPNTTIAALDGRFEISLTNTWDGVFEDFYLGYYGSTWLEPTKWVDYDADGDSAIDGVIGTAGMAWWAAYGVNTQEALDADIAAWITSCEDWIFTAKLDGVEYSIESHRDAVAEPATMLLLGAGLLGLTGLGRRFKRS
jgi:hypothetical protein